MSSNEELTCQEVVELVTDYLENALLPATLRQMRINELLCRGLYSVS